MITTPVVYGCSWRSLVDPVDPTEKTKEKTNGRLEDEPNGQNSERAAEQNVQANFFDKSSTTRTGARDISGKGKCVFGAGCFGLHFDILGSQENGKDEPVHFQKLKEFF
ncbi:hypothetical protein M9H77_24120 [Catharanthus roseus]|uniref:Uncharacterized protein n=1 Tax=Catharanthus roseus TaxID=4058 RepID=A0ACC0AUU5_CATRO|nr:hypothetical protein M9H77_24120 [Catharanthus roseus]